MTPFVAAIHARHKSFHADIARRAASVPQKKERGYSIPNTPYGVKKVALPIIRLVHIPFHSTEYSRLMWFYDLVNYVPGEVDPPRIEFIQRSVARHYGVTKLDIISGRRTKDVVIPRQVSMYLARTMTQQTLPEIGRRFGGRDHTTILHSVRKVESLLETDPALAEVIRLIKVELAA